MDFSFTDLGLDKEGENLNIAFKIGNLTKIQKFSTEELQAKIDKKETEAARKEEAARFNKFRRK